MAALVPAPAQVDQLAVGVELELGRGIVADVDRAGLSVALQAVDVLAAQTTLAAHAVEHLEVAGMPGGRAHDEGAEGVGLGHAAKLGEGARAEARVPDPGIAIVPVALP